MSTKREIEDKLKNIIPDLIYISWGVEEKGMNIICHHYVSLTLNILNDIAKILDTNNLVVEVETYPSDSYVYIIIKNIGIVIQK